MILTNINLDICKQIHNFLNNHDVDKGGEINFKFCQNFCNLKKAVKLARSNCSAIFSSSSKKSLQLFSLPNSNVFHRIAMLIIFMMNVDIGNYF